MFRFAPLFFLAGALGLAAPAHAQDLATRAQAAAADLSAVCREDDGDLWGVSLCGPLIVVDPATREAWANQQDSGGVLQPSGTGFAGVLPPDAPLANTSVEWSGVRWIMLVYVPEDATERRVLVAHEAWHRVQPGLGFTGGRTDNAHLATEMGRYWLRLELRALASALRSRGAGQRRAARDALAFRAARHAAFADAAVQETALDRNEGLAAYTGTKLGAGAAAGTYAANTLDTFDSHQAYARAYAYATGPAYGLLLDKARRGGVWRRTLGDAAPGDVLAGMIRFRHYTEAQLTEAAGRYSGTVVAAEERARAEAQAVRIAELRARFGEGSLVLPLTSPRIEFNPNQLLPVDGLGTYYETLTVRDAWGVARATQGAVIAPGFDRLLLAAPGLGPTGYAGPGWTLELTPGAQITPPPGLVPPPMPAPAPAPRR
jgi:hypothetical protein